MHDIRLKIAAHICNGDAVLNYRGWLAQEAGDLALKIAGLDEIAPQAILPLVQMAANGEFEASALALVTDIEECDIQNLLDALCEYKFAEVTSNGYKATPSGEQVFIAIGKTMVIRERYELKRRLDYLDSLYQQLNDF